MNDDIKALLDKDPNSSPNTVLSSLTSKFLQMLSQTYTNSGLKTKLIELIERIFISYTRDIQEAFDNRGFSESTYIDFIRDKITELGNHVRNQLETHGAVMISSLSELTSQELQQVLTIEQDSSISSESKIQRQSEVTAEKEEKADECFANQQEDDTQSIDSIRPYLDDIVDEITRYVERLTKDKRHDEIMDLKHYINEHLSPKVTASLSETLKSHTKALYTAYNNSNDYYERTVQELLQYFQERDKQKSSPDVPTNPTSPEGPEQ